MTASLVRLRTNRDRVDARSRSGLTAIGLQLVEHFATLGDRSREVPQPEMIDLPAFSRTFLIPPSIAEIVAEIFARRVAVRGTLHCLWAVGPAG